MAMFVGLGVILGALGFWAIPICSAICSTRTVFV
jgi:hypothetical protein